MSVGRRRKTCFGHAKRGGPVELIGLKYARVPENSESCEFGYELRYEKSRLAQADFRTD